MKKHLYFLILLLGINQIAYAETYFWIGNNSQWNDGSNWSLNSGGSPSHIIPNENDNVIFDKNSYKNGTYQILFEDVKIKSFLYTSNQQLSFIGKKIEISDAFNINKIINFQTNLIFNSTDKKTHLINTGGYDLNSNVFIKNGIWKLENHLILNEKSKIIIENGSFISNEKSIYVGSFIVDKADLINLSNSHVFIFNKIDLSNTSKVGGEFILNASSEVEVIKGKYKSFQTKDQTTTCAWGLTLEVFITSNYNGQHISCNGECDGELTIVASGTPGPYSYRFNSVGPFTNQTVYPGLCAGTYTITVKDSSQVLGPGIFANCNIIDVITEPAVISFEILGVINPSCPSFCDGQGFTDASGGTGALTFFWSGSGEITQNPVGLCVGQNEVTITDINGCVEVDEVDIADPPAIDFDVLITPPSCNGDSDAEILISNETGGNGGPYTYFYNPAPTSGQGTNNGIGFADGNVTISVFDADGCQQDSIVTIVNPPVLDITAINPVNNTCFNSCDGSITADPFGGVPPYTFEWFDNITLISTGFTAETPNTFCAGTYFVTVTDAANCSVSSIPVVITEPLEVTANATANSISCFGDCDGSVSTNSMDGGTPPYGFTWTTFPGGVGVGGTQNVNSLCPGEYQVIVNDNNGCESNPIVVEVLDVPEITLNLIGTDPSCFESCDGTIEAVAGGGVGGFIYLWSPVPPAGQGTPTISDVCGGINYSVLVTDANGCDLDDNLTLTDPPQITFDVDITPPSCNGDNDAEILISNEAGGNGGPYTYFYTPAPTSGQATNNGIGFSAGNVTISVFDVDNCQRDSIVSIADPLVLTVDAIDPINNTCFNSCDGSITADPFGGVPPYTFEWFDNTTMISTGFTAETPNTFCAGTYFVTVTDATNCTASSLPVVITEPLPVTANATANPISCFGDCDGSVSANSMDGGTPPYGFTWTTFPGGVGVGGTQNVNSLCPGEYQVIVNDDNGCESNPIVVEVLDVPEITLNLIGTDPSCFESCDGTIEAVAGGGVGGFIYLWSPVPPAGQGTPTISDVCGGINYSVLVTDANGCDLDDNLTLTDPPQITFDVDITPPTCNGDDDGEILISNEAGGNGGPYTYFYNPAPTSGQATNNGIGFSTGNVTISVFDVDNCQRDSIVSIADPLVLTVDAIDPINNTCFNSCDGSLTASPSGGVAPYTYEWIDNTTMISTGLTAETPSTLCAGTYFVIATDAFGCDASSLPVSITEPDPITGNAIANPISCFGICDGSTTVNTLAGGTPPYGFSWTTFPGGVGVGATQTILGLCPGEYQVVISDNNGCTSNPFVVEVLDAPQLTVNLIGTDPSCFNDCDGTIEAVAVGGTGGLNYLWAPVPPVGQGTPIISSICGGINYSVTVTDVNGCNVVGNHTLANPPQYDISSIVTNLDCFGDIDGEISITVNSGGDGGPYTFLWAPVPPVGQGTPNVSGLTAGLWQVIVTDGVGCDTTLSFNITSPTVMDVNASVISNVSCFNGCNGSAQVAVSGGTPGYSISWNDPGNQTTNVASGLCAGNYIVSVTDNNGCLQTDNISITQPTPYNVTVSQTDLDCFGDCDATATVTVNSGGTLPYSISWNDPLNQNTFTAIGLCAGVYQATLSDGNNCDTIIIFTIVEPTELDVTLSVDNSSCFASCSGQASLTVLGGSPGYTFEWFNAVTNNPLGVNSDVITNLCPGTYYATVTDVNGCSFTTAIFEITELPEIISSIVSTNDALCGICDGDAEISVSGGAGGFTIVWAPAPGTGQGTTNASDMCGGVYNVLIQDANGCIDNLGVTINSVALEELELDSVDVSCFGLSDGEVNVNFVCLVPVCNIEWFDAATGITTGQFGNSATGLPAGEYQAVLTNGGGCVTSGNIIVNQPDPIVGTLISTNVTCFGACNGTASVIASGGVGTLTYNWIPLPGTGQGTPNVTGICAGPLNVIVTDENNCSINLNTTITQPNDVVINAVGATDVTCFGANDGIVTVIAAGGVPPLSYEWFICATNISIGTGSQILGVTPGSYYVVITDNNGCTETSSCVTVNEQIELTATINQSNVTCFGDCNGIMTVNPAGGNGTYFIQWLDGGQNPIGGQTSLTYNNVCQGNYFVQVTDGAGCSIIVGPINLTEPADPWNIDVSSIDISCNGDCDGLASVNVLAGNFPPYSYQWNDPLNQITPTATSLCPGTYEIVISDAGVCDTTIQIVINNVPAFFANGVQTNINCFGDCDGEASVNPSNGVAPYTITWSDGQVGNTASNLCAGNITATITDATGCSLDTLFIITQPASGLSAVSAFSNNSACGECNGSATINVNGGVGPYIFFWSPAPGAGQGTNNATGYCPGVVSVQVTDQNGCIFIEAFPIQDINGEILTINVTDASCFGVCDGELEVDYICGDPGCTQEWFNANTGVSLGETGTISSGLCADDYYVQVINNSSCVSIEAATITSPTEIIANDIVNLITCNGDNDGNVTVTPTGGSGAGYTFVWNPIPPNGQGTNTATDLSPGTWDLTITDGDGCSIDLSYDFIEPTPIVLTPSFTNITCNGACDGTISVNAVGGYGGYTYQWFFNGNPIVGATNSNVTGLCPGNYNVEVTDLNGCVQTLINPITLGQPIGITSTFVATNILCFGACTGTITLSPSGGSLPYIINWYDATTNALIGQTGETATNLCQGTYYAIITDNNNCGFQTVDIDITEPTLLTFVLNSTDASCFGICDGTGEITLNGGTPPYSYQWLDVLDNPIPGGLNPNVINLCAGAYSVNGFDDNGCSVGEQTVVINQFSEITATTLSNDADCGNNNGSASVFPLGGNPPYTFQWFDNAMTAFPGETNSNIINISSGTYHVEVTDDNGCSETFTANVSNLPTTTVTFDNIINPTCFGFNNGSIEITATGVNLPLSFLWNPGGITDEDPTNLSAGNYTLQITDGLGCINFYDASLMNPPQITINPTVVNSDCDQCNGSVTNVLGGGLGVLTSNWNNGATGTFVPNLCPGIYEVTVVDGNGCVETEQVTIGNTSGNTADAVLNIPLCNNSCDGEVTVNGIGGTPPYTYNWLHDGSTSNNLTGLCEGDYFVEVADATGCIFPLEVNINNPNEITVVDNIFPPTCGNNDGQINIISNGGVLPHTYSWNTGDITPTITNLDAGVYILTITDNAGCTEELIVGLSNSDAPSINLTNNNISCNGTCSGEISSTVTGGTPTYNYQWYDENGIAIAGETNPTILSLCAGEYLLEVTDNAGCISFANTDITEPSEILLNTPFIGNVSCSGGCDAFAIVNVIGGAIPYSYQWNDPSNQTTAQANDLCAGSYNVTITDGNGCIINQNVDVNEPVPIVISVDNIVGATCVNSTDGEIYISTTGGIPNFTYQWISQLGDTIITTDPELIGVLPMDYYLTVFDNNGCFSQDTITVDTILVVLAFAGNDTLICFGSEIILEGSSNQVDADFTWYNINSIVLSDTNLLELPNQPSGNITYVLMATYSGCSHTDTIQVTIGDLVYADAGLDQQIYVNNSGIIGGNPTNLENTTLVWVPSIYLNDSTVSNPNVLFPQENTWYTVFVTDTNGCVGVDSVYIEVIPTLQIPNGISPNGDGLNDTWILGFKIDFPNLEVSVYNRWGELLFYDNTGYQNEWDGTFKGKRLPIGTYYYVIELNDEAYPEPFTGPITIMR